MILKRLFDIVASLCGLLLIWWVYPIVAILIKIKMPGGPAFFCQQRVGKDGKLFTCHKFRSMLVAPARNENVNENENKNGWSSVSVAGDSRITPFGAKLRHYKIDELPELWDVLIGNMSFVGPRPDVPGYADQLQGEDRVVLKLRPGITGPATLKYRLEDEMLEDFVHRVKNGLSSSFSADAMKAAEPSANGLSFDSAQEPKGDFLNSLNLSNISNLPDFSGMTDQELAVWYNDNVIYPDKVRLNKYYYEHYSFVKDIEMIFATVLGFKVQFAGEEI